jgi:hypothetical protein
VSFRKQITTEVTESYKLPIWLLLALPLFGLKRKGNENEDEDGFETQPSVEQTALNKPYPTLQIETAPKVKLENLHERSRSYFEILKLNPEFERFCTLFDRVLIEDLQDNGDSYKFFVQQDGRRTLILSSRALVDLYEKQGEIDITYEYQQKRLKWLNNFIDEAGLFLSKTIPKNNWRPSRI